MEKVIGCLLAILVLPLLLLWLAVYWPIDYIRYKCSLMYKETGEKYTFLKAMSVEYKLYHCIRRADLPITYIYCPADDAYAYSRQYFVYKDILLLCDFGVVRFDEEKGFWVLDGESDECPEENLEEEMAAALEEYRVRSGREACLRSVVVVEADSQNLPENDVQRAEESGLFLVYGDDLTAALKAFMESH